MKLKLLFSLIFVAQSVIANADNSKELLEIKKALYRVIQVQKSNDVEKQLLFKKLTAIESKLEKQSQDASKVLLEVSKEPLSKKFVLESDTRKYAFTRAFYTNVRKEKSLSSTILSVLPRCSKIEVQGCQRDENGKSWCKIYNSGVTGYIRKYLLSLESNAQTYIKKGNQIQDNVLSYGITLDKRWVCTGDLSLLSIRKLKIDSLSTEKGSK